MEDLFATNPKNLKLPTTGPALLPVCTRERRPGMSPNTQMFAQGCSEEKLRAICEGYSYRSATIGSTRMARRAGR